MSIRVVQGRFDSYRVMLEPIDLPAGNALIFEIGGRPDLLYKQFSKAHRDGVEIERIEGLIEIGTRLADGADASAAVWRIAWPRDLVLEGDELVGVVIPHAGARFYRPQRGEALLPRDLSYLRRDEEGVTTTVRLGLMRQLAGTVGALEHADLVHGDISQQNLLWAPPPQESIMLIDCDGIHGASSEGPKGATPNWVDPRKKSGAIASHDMKSDWFALSLAVWRVLSRSKGMPPRENGKLALPTTLPLQVRELLERTFADAMDPAPRPSPREWAGALESVLGSKRARRRIDRIEPAALFHYEHNGVKTPVGPAAPRPGRARAPRPAPRAVSPASTRRRPRTKRVLFFALVLAVVVVLVAGLVASDPSGPQRRAQAAVSQWAKSRLHTRGISAECPGDSSLHAGARYVCRVETHSGAVARVHVSIGAEGGISRRMRVIAYRRRAVLTDIRARYRHLRQRGDYGLRRISCPRTFSARPGTDFQCSARFTDDVKGAIRVRLHSRRGGFSWQEAGVGVGGRGSALR